jgi:hypothetical protein
MEKLINHRELDPPNLQNSAPNVSPGLAAIFAKMVAKDPGDRFQTMTELAEDIDALQDGRRPTALAPLWTGLWNSLRANPWPAISSGAAVFVIGLAIWLFSGGLNNSAANKTASASDPQDNVSKQTDSQFADNRIGGNGGWAPGVDPIDTLMQKLRNARPKVMVLVSSKDFDQNEVDRVKACLTENNFDPILASSTTRATPKYSKKSVRTLKFYQDFNPKDYFGVVVTSSSRSEFKTGPVISLLK